MKKDGANYTNFFIPNFMVRFAPGHMRDMSKQDDSLNYANLYSLNKTSEIEDGLSAILGFDFKINEKDSDPIKSTKYILNALKRENNQRNHIQLALKNVASEDVVMISDQRVKKIIFKNKKLFKKSFIKFYILNLVES